MILHHYQNLLVIDNKIQILELAKRVNKYTKLLPTRHQHKTWIFQTVQWLGTKEINVAVVMSLLFQLKISWTTPITTRMKQQLKKLFGLQIAVKHLKYLENRDALPITAFCDNKQVAHAASNNCIRSSSLSQQGPQLQQTMPTVNLQGISLVRLLCNLDRPTINAHHIYYYYYCCTAKLCRHIHTKASSLQLANDFLCKSQRKSW